MPFKSISQKRLCYILQEKAKREGKKFSWDCKEWDRETKGKLPFKISSNKKLKKPSISPKRIKKFFDLPKISLGAYGYKMSLSENERRKILKETSKIYGKKNVKDKLLKLSILFSNRPQREIINSDLEFVKKLKV